MTDSSPKLTQANPYKRQFNFPSCPLAVRDVLESVSDAIAQAGLSEDNCGIVEIVLAEALNNIVEHAYSNREDGEISLKIVVWDKSLICDISDQGHPMPDFALPKSSHADLSGEIDTLPEGGWGWMMIRELSKTISYRREGGRNYLSFQLSP